MKHTNQKGFSILSVILVIVAIIVAIGVWALSGQNNTSTNSTSTNDILATTIINDGLRYKMTYDNYRLNNIPIAKLIFSPNLSDPNNLLDPIVGTTWEQANKRALVANAVFPKGYWGFNKLSFAAPNIGSASRDSTFLISGISKPVCERINKTLHGSTDIPIFTDSNYETTDDIMLTDAMTYNYVYMHYLTTANRWLNGCINHNNNENDNFYFQTVRVV